VSQRVEGVGGDHVQVVPPGQVLDRAVPHAVGAHCDPLPEEVLDLLRIELPRICVQRDDRHIFFQRDSSFWPFTSTSLTYAIFILQRIPALVKARTAIFRGLPALGPRKRKLAYHLLRSKAEDMAAQSGGRIRSGSMMQLTKEEM